MDKRSDPPSRQHRIEREWNLARRKDLAEKILQRIKAEVTLSPSLLPTPVPSSDWSQQDRIFLHTLRISAD